MVSEDRREWRVIVIIVKWLEPAARHLTSFGPETRRSNQLSYHQQALSTLSDVSKSKPIVPRLQKNKGKR